MGLPKEQQRHDRSSERYKRQVRIHPSPRWMESHRGLGSNFPPFAGFVDRAVGCAAAKRVLRPWCASLFCHQRNSDLLEIARGRGSAWRLSTPFAIQTPRIGKRMVVHVGLRGVFAPHAKTGEL